MTLLNSENIITGILFLPIFYLWKQLYTTYIDSKRQHEEKKLFYRRHNCVIMYSRSYMRGWPPKDIIEANTSNLNLFLEPYLYFINTANHSLDIASMKIAIVPIFNALEAAVARGVKVRIIVNFLTSKSISEIYQNILKTGIKVAFYVDKTGKLSNIMHYKYMVKDYELNKGYLCMGSLNFTSITSILKNYEDVTFTSNTNLVQTFHENFEESWRQINNDNENIYNKTVLTEHGFL